MFINNFCLTKFFNNMKKVFLRFGALALMSMMSIGAFAINTVGETFTSPTDGNEYRITKVYTADPVSIGEVELVKWNPTIVLSEVGDRQIQDSYYNVFMCTSIKGKTTPTDVAAFAGTDPGNITIGESITKIGVSAFSDLSDDVTITFDLDASKLVEIGNNAFNPAIANTVTVSNTLLDLSKAAVNTLGDGAFAKVAFPAAGTEVHLGDIATVPAKLFQNSTNLTKVLFNALNKLTDIKESAFEGCSSIEWFGYFDTVLDAHFLPYTLSAIGKNAFKGALHFDAVNKLPEFKFSVSFKNAGLADVPFAEITNVGESAFENCTWLNNVYFCNLFPAQLGTAADGDYVKVLANGQRSYAVFTYGNAAFAGAALSKHYDFTARTDVTFNNAFKGNAAITEAILPTSTEAIGYEAFKGCTALKLCDLTKLPVLATIEYDAFMNTNAYVNVWIPNTVTFIGKDAFSRGVTEPVSSATNRTYDESSCAQRTIAILSKESTVANDVSKVIKSYVKCSTNPNRYHATQPIVDYTNTKLVVPMGLMKAYATAKFPATGHIENCSSSPEGYDWSPAAAGHLYTYNTDAKNQFDKIYVGYYEYTVTANWSNQYTPGCSEYPLVKLTKINNVALPTNKTSYTQTLFNNSITDKTDNFTFQLPQTVCALNEWNNGATSVSKSGSQNTKNGFLGLNSENNANGVNFVFYWVIETEKMSVIGTNAGFPNAIKNHVTEAEVQANKIDLTSVFDGCTNLASFNFQGYPSLVNANNASGNTPKNAVTGWYGAIGAPNEANIGDNAFKECTSLATFNGVTEAGFKYTDGTGAPTDNTVGKYAFYNCPLTSVVIPNNVFVIDNNAYQKTKIQAVKFPMELKTINDYAFANTPLTWVRLPKSITHIGQYVFDGRAKEIEGKGDLEGIVVDGELEGVLDIYAYWGKTELALLDVDPNAFGGAEKVFVGEEPKYIVRRLYIPDGETDGIAGNNDYTEKAPFNENHKFTFAEGIIARTQVTGTPSRENDLYGTGRLDIEIHQKTAVRKLTIVDNNDIKFFRISKTTPNVQVTYKRKVQAGVYNPLFVPFSVAGVGDDYQIYKVFDTKVDETGNESIEYVKLRADEATRPNVPYVILPTVNEIELKAKAYQDEHITPLPAKNSYFNTTDVCNYAVSPAVTTDPRVTCSDAANEYKFYGTVQEKFGTTVAADAFYALTSENHFAKMTNPSKSVKALRFYMTTREKNYGTEYFYIKGLDLDEVTAIENVKANSLNAPMFDLMGRQITAPAKGQVYIQNGVKKLAK